MTRRTATIQRWIFLFCAAVYCGDRLAFSADVDKSFYLLLDEMKSRREIFKTGEFEVSGSKFERDKTYGDFKAETHAVCDFDIPNGRIRFDRRQQVRDYKNPDPKNGRLWSVGVWEGQFFRTKRETTFLRKGDTSVHVQPPTAEDPHWAQPFDVRALGLHFSFEIESKLPFDTLWKNWHVTPNTEIVAEKNGIVKCVGKSDDGLKRTVWIDTARDYWPVRLEIQDRRRTADKKGIETYVALDATLTLDSFDGHWVPRHCTMERPWVVYDFELHWKSLNRPLDDARFTLESFDLSGVRSVIDSRSGQPKITREFDSPKTRKDGA